MYRTLALALVLTACTGPADKDTAGGGGDATAGAEVYTASCAACHGADGAGTDTYPSLVEEVPEKSDAQLEDIILNGTGSMAPVALDEQELTDLLAYLRQEFGG